MELRALSIGLVPVGLKMACVARGRPPSTPALSSCFGIPLGDLFYVHRPPRGRCPATGNNSMTLNLNRRQLLVSADVLVGTSLLATPVVFGQSTQPGLWTTDEGIATISTQLGALQSPHQRADPRDHQSASSATRARPPRLLPDRRVIVDEMSGLAFTSPMKREAQSDLSCAWKGQARRARRAWPFTPWRGALLGGFQLIVAEAVG